MCKQAECLGLVFDDCGGGYKGAVRILVGRPLRRNSGRPAWLSRFQPRLSALGHLIKPTFTGDFYVVTKLGGSHEAVRAAAGLQNPISTP